MFYLLFSLQTLKCALSPYKLGGAAGGSDLDPKGKSDGEVLILSYDIFVFYDIFIVLTSFPI